MALNSEKRFASSNQDKKSSTGLFGRAPNKCASPLKSFLMLILCVIKVNVATVALKTVAKLHYFLKSTNYFIVKIQLSNATFVVLIKSIIFVEKKMGTKVPIRARNLDFLKCFLNLFVL
jgi:hypothetical protein